MGGHIGIELDEVLGHSQELVHQLAGLLGVGLGIGAQRAADPEVGLLLDERLEEGTVGGVVLDDQDHRTDSVRRLPPTGTLPVINHL